MTDGVERAQSRRNLLERIAARIPGIKGYLDRELRREVDKMQRDWLAEQVDRVRGRLNGKVREIFRVQSASKFSRLVWSQVRLLWWFSGI